MAYLPTGGRIVATQSERQELDHEQLGNRLREAREFLGYSQEYVADRLGIPRASVSAIETGKRKVSSLELKQLSQLYKRPVEELLADGETDETADETVAALFRTAQALSSDDREQLLRFAEFLRAAGPVPASDVSDRP